MKNVIPIIFLLGSVFTGCESARTNFMMAKK